MSLKIRFRASFDTFCAKHKGARSKDIFGRKWQFFGLLLMYLTGIQSVERSTCQNPGWTIECAS